MNSLIFNTLILTLNDDILVILNDLVIFNNFNNSGQSGDTLIVHHVSSRRRAIPQYMLVANCSALYQSSSECPGNTDEIFIYISESFFF
jgi:hypothetical protein